MNKALLLALALLLAAVGIALYVGPQRAMLVTVHKLFTLQKQYMEDNSTGLSAEARAFEAMLRAMPPKGDTLQELRNTMDDFAHFVPLPSTTSVEAVKINANLQGYWVTPADSKEDDGGRVVFYLHGGGYVAGSSVGYLGWVSEIASRIKGRGFFVEYRLAPESPLPIAVEDSIAAYRYVTETKKVDPKKLVIMGDSAGGGLTLLTLLSLQDNKLPVPAAAVTFSAWTDYYGSAEMPNSYTTKVQSDAMLNPVIMKNMALTATGTKEEEFDKRKSPKISPLYADLKKVRFPPLLMSVGDAEVLLDDTLRFYGKALQANLDVTLEQAKGMQHIYPFLYQFIEEAEKGLQQAVDFALKHLA